MDERSFQLGKPRSVRDWLSAYRLYLAAFPVSERKPFSIIRKMYRQGKTDIWCVKRGKTFLGLVTTINSPNLILLDYLAVCEASRGMGVGSAVLERLKKRYADKGIFVEIESTTQPCADLHMRLRRKGFYCRCGMEPMGVEVRLFGVDMELLGYGCRLDFAGYKSFYRESYSPWAAEHIQEISDKV